MSGASRSRNSRGVSERASENATTQIGPEVALDPCGDTAPKGVRLCRLREESLEVLLDQRGRAASEWDGAGGRRAHSLVRWAEGGALVPRPCNCTKVSIGRGSLEKQWRGAVTEPVNPDETLGGIN